MSPPSRQHMQHRPLLPKGGGILREARSCTAGGQGRRSLPMDPMAPRGSLGCLLASRLSSAGGRWRTVAWRGCKQGPQRQAPMCQVHLCVGVFIQPDIPGIIFPWICSILPSTQLEFYHPSVRLHGTHPSPDQGGRPRTHCTPRPEQQGFDHGELLPLHWLHWPAGEMMLV